MEKKLGKATRDAYGLALIEIGKANPNVVVLDADLSKSTKTAEFGKMFPDRFFNVGIQEANLVSVASGLASCGKIPFISSFASFLMCKGYDQLRMGVAFPELSVKVVPSHGGISVGEDGASQMSIEDVALACTLPGFAVMVPSDEFCARALVWEAVKRPGPVYIRTCRPKCPILHDASTSFEIGKGIKLRDGKDITIIANGLLVFEALEAAEALDGTGVQATVLEMHTIKPLDKELILAAAKKTGHVLVAEEHSIWGGLSSAVATLLSKEHPCRMDFVAIQDTYAESGHPDELLDVYGLSSRHVLAAARRLLKK
ncbi:MAG: transketolase C-terminal domain-containing protein [Candidatus Omnitrophica bacterium]|nr:transketolase C-terminal domain-containing protein [Candidatus Omnitrophota bacterium]MDD5670522.1 transketolase C-terminal domain-containing protein [Candidatus Omnitrophota bacterium]